MESVTQALLGAAVGQCFTGKLGRRAVWWGALGGTLPDLDVLVIPFTGQLGEYEWHRGPTHSFWFGPVVGTLFAYATWRWYQRRAALKPVAAGEPDPAAPGALRWWILLWFLALFTHPLLDIFTPYGTMFLAPFSNHRFAANAVAILDPMYSLPLIAALIFGARMKGRWRTQLVSALIVLALTTGYLFYGLWLNGAATERARADLVEEGVANAEVNVYPTILQIFLRRAVARAGDDIHVSHFTMWKDVPIAWESFQNAQGPEVELFRETHEAKVFSWFAANETVVQLAEQDGKRVVEMDDLRYGLPGTPRFGLWGMRAELSEDGKLLGEPQVFNRPRAEDLAGVFGQLWRGTFGLDVQETAK